MQRHGREAAGQPDDPGPDGEHHRLPALPGRGPDHRHSLHDLPRRRPRPRGAHPAGRRSRRGSTMASGSRSRARARPARAAARRATCTWRSRCASTPELLRRGTELFHELPVTFPQAALGATLRFRPSKARRRSSSGRARAATSSACAARRPSAARRRTRRPARDRHRRGPAQALEARARAARASSARSASRRSCPRAGPSVFDRLRDLFS